MKKGTLYLCNNGAITWAGFAKEIAYKAGLDISLIGEVTMEQMNLAAKRPLYSVLSFGRSNLMPSIAEAIDSYIIHCNDNKSQLNSFV